jgi:hypothetical protein
LISPAGLLATAARAWSIADALQPTSADASHDTGATAATLASQKMSFNPEASNEPSFLHSIRPLGELGEQTTKTSSIDDTPWLKNMRPPQTMLNTQKKPWCPGEDGRVLQPYLLISLRFFSSRAAPV